MADLLHDALQRKQQADAILADLRLVEHWAMVGRPVLVGAYAYGLLCDPDIDLEVYCPELRIEHGFDVLRACALHPGVVKASFSNELATEKALYWQIRYQSVDRTVWKIDMWSAPDDYALPRAEYLIAPMQAALTPTTRRAILALKAARSRDPGLACLSIDLYRAVLDDGVRTADELRAWLAAHPTGQLTDWRPTS